MMKKFAFLAGMTLGAVGAAVFMNSKQGKDIMKKMSH